MGVSISPRTTRSRTVSFAAVSPRSSASWFLGLLVAMVSPSGRWYARPCAFIDPWRPRVSAAVVGLRHGILTANSTNRPAICASFREALGGARAAAPSGGVPGMMGGRPWGLGTQVPARGGTPRFGRGRRFAGAAVRDVGGARAARAGMRPGTGLFGRAVACRDPVRSRGCYGLSVTPRKGCNT